MKRIFFPAILSTLACCSSAPPQKQPEAISKPVNRFVETQGPKIIVLVENPVVLGSEPNNARLDLDFTLPKRPRRARLVLSYSGVPGATSKDYTMGKFRHKILLNNAYLMDLNTHSNSESHTVEYTKWISVGMFRRHNKIAFTAGDNGQALRDQYTLNRASLEFDW